MLYININNIWTRIYVYNMVYSTCYITPAIYHTCFAYIAWAYPECYVTVQNVVWHLPWCQLQWSLSGATIGSNGRIHEIWNICYLCSCIEPQIYTASCKAAVLSSLNHPAEAGRHQWAVHSNGLPAPAAAPGALRRDAGHSLRLAAESQSPAGNC